MSLAFLLAFAAAAASNTDPLAIQAVHNYGACIAQQTPRGVRSSAGELRPRAVDNTVERRCKQR